MRFAQIATSVAAVVALPVVAMTAGPMMSNTEFLNATRCVALESVHGEVSWDQANLNAEARRQPAQVTAAAKAEVAEIAAQAARADTVQDAADIAAQRNAACSSPGFVARGAIGGDAA